MTSSPIQQAYRDFEFQRAYEKALQDFRAMTTHPPNEANDSTPTDSSASIRERRELRQQRRLDRWIDRCERRLGRAQTLGAISNEEASVWQDQIDELQEGREMLVAGEKVGFPWATLISIAIALAMELLKVIVEWWQNRDEE